MKKKLLNSNSFILTVSNINLIITIPILVDSPFFKRNFIQFITKMIFKHLKEAFSIKYFNIKIH